MLYETRKHWVAYITTLVLHAAGAWALWVIWLNVEHRSESFARFFHIEQSTLGWIALVVAILWLAKSTFALASLATVRWQVYEDGVARCGGLLPWTKVEQWTPYHLLRDLGYRRGPLGWALGYTDIAFNDP